MSNCRQISPFSPVDYPDDLDTDGEDDNDDLDTDNEDCVNKAL